MTMYIIVTVILIDYHQFFYFCPWRFHNAAREPALNYDVVLPVDDDVQLSAVQYRNALYEVQNVPLYFITFI